MDTTFLGQSSSASPSTASMNMPEAILLRDDVYLNNVLQKGLTGQALTLTLYPTHLSISATDTGETIEDVAINDIQKTNRYYTSRLRWTLRNMFVGVYHAQDLNIKTPATYYHFSWLPVGKMVKGNAQKNFLDSNFMSVGELFKKEMAWVKAIQELKAGSASGSSQRI